MIQVEGLSKRKHCIIFLFYSLRNLSLPDLVQGEKEALEIRFLFHRQGMIEYMVNDSVCLLKT